MSSELSNKNISFLLYQHGKLNKNFGADKEPYLFLTHSLLKEWLLSMRFCLSQKSLIVTGINVTLYVPFIVKLTTLSC